MTGKTLLNRFLNLTKPHLLNFPLLFTIWNVDGDASRAEFTAADVAHDGRHGGGWVFTVNTQMLLLPIDLL